MLLPDFTIYFEMRIARFMREISAKSNFGTAHVMAVWYKDSILFIFSVYWVRCSDVRTYHKWKKNKIYHTSCNKTSTDRD